MELVTYEPLHIKICIYYACKLCLRYEDFGCVDDLIYLTLMNLINKKDRMFYFMLFTWLVIYVVSIHDLKSIVRYLFIGNTSSLCKWF